MNTQRKFNRRYKQELRQRMKQILFEAESYKYVEEPVKTLTGIDTGKIYKGYKYNKTDDRVIGLFELLWVGITQSQSQDLSKPDFKVIKRLKKKLREISRFKDADNDSRILLENDQVLILEGDEYSLVKRLLEANKFSASIADDVDALWEKVDSATDYDPPKPKLDIQE